MPETKRRLKVFLCHASADKPKVRELYRTLRRRGMQPWLDSQDLIPGQNWEVEIPKALLSSDAIIICLSSNSVDKEGYVQKEIKFALDKALEIPEGRIFLIPARLEECDLPYSLSKYQAVNLFEKDGYTKLMKALKLRASDLHLAVVELPKTSEITGEIEKIVEEKKEVSPSDSKVVNLDVGGDDLQDNEAHQDAERQHAVKIQDDSRKQVVDKIQPEILKKLPSREDEPDKADIPQFSKSKTQHTQSSNTKTKRKPNIAIAVALIGLAGTIIAALFSLPLIEKWFSPSPSATELAIVTATLTSRPATPSYTMTPSPTLALSPTLAITQVSIPTTLPSEVFSSEYRRLVLISAGEFTMGSENGNVDEKPPHQVYVPSFYIDKFEVTNSNYKECVDAGVCDEPYSRTPATSHYSDSNYWNHPVVYVDWNMARIYCEWRGTRLPTEAEWEKAARGADGRTYPWGEEIGCNQTNYNGDNGFGILCIGGTTRVGSYESGQSPYGLHDMAGNVWEWVADWYDKDYYFDSPSSNPQGPTSGQYRVIRGGSYYEGADFVRAANREDQGVDSVFAQIGFRCARDATP